MSAKKNVSKHPAEYVAPDDSAAGDPLEQGISLDELNDAFSALVGAGHDPFVPLDLKRGKPAALETGEAEEESPAKEGTGEERPSSRKGVDACPVSPRTILEGTLFVGNATNTPLEAATLAAAMRGVRASEIDSLIRELNQQYLEDGAPYRIVGEGAGYRLSLAPEFAAIKERFSQRVRHGRLSSVAIEILSLVAYRGPLTSEEIVELRGKPNGGTLSLLVRRQLLRVERTQAPRRINRYSVTPRFLELFGIDSLSDLPRTPDADLP